MKKILISALVLVLGATTLNAQSPWFLSGELGFGYDKAVASSTQDLKTTTFSIRPSVGYMLNDNWGLMLDLGYTYRKAELTVADVKSTGKENTFGAGVGVIYKCNIAGDFYYAPTARVGYDRHNESKINLIGVDLSVLRFEFRPSTNWGFNVNFGGLGFQYIKMKDVDASTAFGLNVGDAAAVGFTYYF